MPTLADFREMLAFKRLADGRGVFVYPLVFGRARLMIGDVDSGSAEKSWDYASGDDAVRACMAWDGTGEPTGYERSNR